MILDDDRGPFDVDPHDEDFEPDEDLDDDEVTDVGGVLARLGLPPSRPTSPVLLPARVGALVDASYDTQLAAVGELVRDSWAPATLDAYQADWRRFAIWSELQNLDPLSATDIDVARYVAGLVDQRLTVATIRRRLAAIAHAYHLTRRASPTRTEIVQRTVRGAARRHPRPLTRARPLGLDEMRAIVRALPIVGSTRPAMRRDQLLIALGWAAALRASELVALDAEDLTFVGDPNTGEGGVILTIRRAKTDRRGNIQHVAVPYATTWTGCPVRLALQHTKTHRQGPLFRSIDRHGKHGPRLGAQSVTNVIQRAIADVLQTDPAGNTSHSLRSGFVTTARQHHVADHRIARHTRHRSTHTILDTYDRPADLLHDHALEPEWW